MIRASVFFQILAKTSLNPPYLEIETQNEEDMKDICIKLDISNGKKGTIVEILPEMFNN